MSYGIIWLFSPSTVLNRYIGNVSLLIIFLNIYVMLSSCVIRRQWFFFLHEVYSMRHGRFHQVNRDKLMFFSNVLMEVYGCFLHQDYIALHADFSPSKSRILSITKWKFQIGAGVSWQRETTTSASIAPLQLVIWPSSPRTSGPTTVLFPIRNREGQTECSASTKKRK